MQRELELRCQGLRPRTIFFGGGTPTHLEADLLEELLDTLRSVVDLSQLEEWTSEANPESCTEEILQLLFEKGVTRFSIGIQSWDEARLQFMDRPHGPDDAERALETARATGAAFSLDMIFGLPDQSLAAWKDELERSLALEPDHLSCYQLTFEPGTALEAARKRGTVIPLADEIQRDMFEWTQERCAAAGYECYELSNFARPGQRCRHNEAYWRGGSYVGIGPGAASHREGRRSTNLRPLEAYEAAIQESGCASFEAEVLGPSSRVREALWLALRTREGFSREEIEARCGAGWNDELNEALAQCLEREELEEVGDRIRIPREKMIYTDTIAQRFL